MVSKASEGTAASITSPLNSLTGTPVRMPITL